MQYDHACEEPSRRHREMDRWMKSEKKCRHIDRSGADLQRQGLGLRDGARRLRREVG